MTSKREPLDLRAIEEGAKRTGFELEFRVAKMLREAHWNVVSSRYYLDDHTEQAREIDIVATRITRSRDLDVYTVLIISCKKSEENAWVFFARPLIAKGPIPDWCPTHAWSNVAAINFNFAKDMRSWSLAYHEKVAALATFDNPLAMPRMDIFAFQEMSKGAGKAAPRNDKTIFDSITGLMKAQWYETGSRPARATRRCVYQYNLLSVVDAPLVCLTFQDEQPVAQEVDNEHYIARYIIEKKETIARIRFLTPDALARLLPAYKELHRSNCTIFADDIADFYDDILEDSWRSHYLREHFIAHLEQHWPWNRQIYRYAARDPHLFWDARLGKAVVALSLSQKHLDLIAPDIDDTIRDALKTVYRYEGPFSLEAEGDPLAYSDHLENLREREIEERDKE